MLNKKIMYQTLIVKKDKSILSVSLNRPEVHNAMNEEMISELTQVFQDMVKDADLPRLVVLRGNGKSFCAGADLNYMKGIAAFGFDENFRDGKKLAVLFQSIYECPAPTMAVVHGSAYGGANGLLSACDIVVATENTRFAFSEVKLGIAPATIAPFVIKRIGEFGAKELMLTGKTFYGKEAEKWHLINHAVAEEKLEEKAAEIIKELQTAAPEAARQTKRLINNIINQAKLDENIDFTARLIATLRASEEGQEGMTAFLEKRKAKWTLEI